MPYHFDRAVVVAMTVVGVVQMAVDEVVHMVAVRNGFVAAVRAVGMVGPMAFARVPLGAIDGVGGAHVKDVLIDVVVMHRVEMTVVKIIDMVVVADCSVAAGFVVLVGVVFVDLVSGVRHGGCSFSGGSG